MGGAEQILFAVVVARVAIKVVALGVARAPRFVVEALTATIVAVATTALVATAVPWLLQRWDLTPKFLLARQVACRSSIRASLTSRFFHGRKEAC